MHHSILSQKEFNPSPIKNLAKMILTPIQATGGVYKKQERFQCEMIIHIYMKFLFHEDTYNTSIQINYLIALSRFRKSITCFISKNVVGVQPRSSKGITDLFSPYPSFRLHELTLHRLSCNSSPPFFLRKQQRWECQIIPSPKQRNNSPPLYN